MLLYCFVAEFDMKTGVCKRSKIVIWFCKALSYPVFRFWQV